MRGARRLALWLAAVLVVALAAPPAARAHGALRRSTPAAGARLTTAPRELRLTFTERVELAVTRVELLGPGDTPVALAPLTTAPDSAQVVVAAIRGPLAGGRYTVGWQVVGRDGHPVRGRYTFTIAADAAGLPTSPDTAAGQPAVAAPPAAGEAAVGLAAPGQGHEAPLPPAAASLADGFGAESPAYVAIRWLTYLALLLVIGAVAFRLAVLGPLGRAPSALDQPLVAGAAHAAARVGQWSAVALLAAAGARLYAQSYALHGAGAALDGGSIGAMLRGTVWGWGWLLQVGAAAVAAAGLWAARRGGARARGGWALAAAAAIVLAVTPALAGHAAAAPRRAPLVVAADALHVLGAGGWLGSLAMLVVAGIPAALALGPGRRGAAVAALVNAFSPTALGFAGLVVATGLAAAWAHVGSVPALWETAYGRTLLVKLAMLSVVGATGAYNWRRVRPALGDDRSVARLRTSSLVELAVGAVAIAVTAALVATPPPAR